MTRKTVSREEFLTAFHKASDKYKRVIRRGLEAYSDCDEKDAVYKMRSKYIEAVKKAFDAPQRMTTPKLFDALQKVAERNYGQAQMVYDIIHQVPALKAHETELGKKSMPFKPEQ